MNDADRKAFDKYSEECVYGSRTQEKLIAALAWQAACEWRDRQNTLWRNAAIRVGEDLHSVGPNGYYNMSAEEWLNWALNTIYSKPNFAPPSAQINQQLVETLERLINAYTVSHSPDTRADCWEQAKAALAATQMRGDA